MSVVMKSEDNLTGEGGVLIHGKAILKNLDRSDLFSQELDRKLTSVVCNVCLAPSRDLASWRQHCVTKHAALPGYGTQASWDNILPKIHWANFNLFLVRQNVKSVYLLFEEGWLKLF